MNDKDLKPTEAPPRKPFRFDPELSKRLLHSIVAQTSKETNLVMRLTSTAFKVEAKLVARKRQSKSAAKRHENLEPRNRWICERWANGCARAKKNNRRYSSAQFRRDLMKSRKRELRPNGKFLTAERLRIIVNEG